VHPRTERLSKPWPKSRSVQHPLCYTNTYLRIEEGVHTFPE